MHHTGTKHIVRHMQKSIVQWSVISKFTCICVDDCDGETNHIYRPTDPSNISVKWKKCQIVDFLSFFLQQIFQGKCKIFPHISDQLLALDLNGLIKSIKPLQLNLIFSLDCPRCNKVSSLVGKTHTKT